MNAPLRVRKEVVLAAPPARVFAALVDPSQLTAYWPFTAVESAGVVGGTIVFHGEVAGQAFTDSGVIEAFEPACHFRYRYWSTNHGTEDRLENRMVVDYRLQSDGEGCRLSVTHENLLASERVAMMDGVWDFLLGQLRAHVEGASVG